MQQFYFKNENQKTILALGAESAGNFSVLHNNKIYFSDNFKDLLEKKNYKKYKEQLNEFIEKKKIKPDIILTDLHPDFKTTHLGQKLAKKFKAKHIKIQHHIAHIFSQLPELQIKNCISQEFYGLALDGTGYGTDGKIWGGEIFKLQATSYLAYRQAGKLQATKIGHLENQIMIGGELAIREPARMLISILSKFLPKKDIYKILKNKSFSHGREKRTCSDFGKMYNESEFELLYNQMKYNFNCQETSSTGRVLDAISVLLGFAKNERKTKHEATYLLEKNSTEPYTNLQPAIKKSLTKSRIINYELQITPLFQYLIKNLHKDKKRLAATAQSYIAQGMNEIIKKHSKSNNSKYCNPSTIISGGISENKIINDYFKPKKIIENKKIPKGDSGISFGQVISYLNQSF